VLERIVARTFVTIRAERFFHFSSAINPKKGRGEHQRLLAIFSVSSSYCCGQDRAKVVLSAKCTLHKRTISTGTIHELDIDNYTFGEMYSTYNSSGRHLKSLSSEKACLPGQTNLRSYISKNKDWDDFPSPQDCRPASPTSHKGGFRLNSRKGGQRRGGQDHQRPGRRASTGHVPPPLGTTAWPATSSKPDTSGSSSATNTYATAILQKLMGVQRKTNETDEDALLRRKKSFSTHEMVQYILEDPEQFEKLKESMRQSGIYTSASIQQYVRAHAKERIHEMEERANAEWPQQTKEEQVPMSRTLQRRNSYINLRLQSKDDPELEMRRAKLKKFLEKERQEKDRLEQERESSLRASYDQREREALSRQFPGRENEHDGHRQQTRMLKGMSSMSLGEHSADSGRSGTNWTVVTTQSRSPWLGKKSEGGKARRHEKDNNGKKGHFHHNRWGGAEKNEQRSPQVDAKKPLLGRLRRNTDTHLKTDDERLEEGKAESSHNAGLVPSHDSSKNENSSGNKREVMRASSYENTSSSSVMSDVTSASATKGDIATTAEEVAGETGTTENNYKVSSASQKGERNGSQERKKLFSRFGLRRRQEGGGENDERDGDETPSKEEATSEKTNQSSKASTTSRFTPCLTKIESDIEGMHVSEGILQESGPTTPL
jgi:hypothetical protein